MYSYIYEKETGKILAKCNRTQNVERVQSNFAQETGILKDANDIEFQVWNQIRVNPVTLKFEKI